MAHLEESKSEALPSADIAKKIARGNLARRRLTTIARMKAR
jgi:hypothetical protein